MVCAGLVAVVAKRTCLRHGHDVMLGVLVAGR